MRLILLKIIKSYQKYISPDHGGFLKYFKPFGVCKFRPTCSDYTYQAINKYGILKGSFLGIKRVLRCNPFNQGGWDPIK